jgi:ABC-type Fe3+/spermidine/putrescine transport system ATPase subunit
VRAAYAPGPPAVADLSLTLTAGEFFSLLGPSGCGKTTLLRLIAGYRFPDSGGIFLAGRDVSREPPERRNIGMVFQNYALFPHLTARANVAFGLEMRNVPRRERRTRVEAMLDRVGLEPAERDRRPSALSGGQQQRVALARALVIEPRLLLLDEPFANLDRRLREQMRDELKQLQRRTGVTTLLVTHDQEEALALADRVGVMAAGRLLQAADPRTLYERPADRFTARFLGDANLFTIENVADDTLLLREGIRLPRRCLKSDTAVKAGSWLMLRTESCVLGAAATECAGVFNGRVTGSTFLGVDQVVAVRIDGGGDVRVRGRPGDWSVGDAVQVGVPAGVGWTLPGDPS